MSARPTPGPWVVTDKEHGGWKTDVRQGCNGEKRRIASTFVCKPLKKGRDESVDDFRARIEAQARQNELNAALIAEAGTVYHDTGLTPRELADQRAELLAALRVLADYDFGEGDVDETLYEAACRDARRVIAKCKAGAA